MKTFLSAIKLTLLFCLLLGGGYVLVLWGVAQVVTPRSGAVVLVQRNDTVVGARRVGQSFTAKRYFWSRPSAVGYDASRSGGSNKATTNPSYLAQVDSLTQHFLKVHPYLKRSEIPSEMVTASGSGLDPQISLAAAQVQVRRVAQARGVKMDVVQTILDQVAECPLVGVSVVNVLEVNLALDEKLNP